MMQIDKTKSTLLLTTFKYPFASGEPFLAAELPYLREHFEQILVQPLFGTDTRRDLPEGFRLCEPLCIEGHRTGFILRQLLRPSVWRDALAEARRMRAIGQQFDPKRLLAWTILRDGLHRSEGARTLLAAEGPRAVYAYWGHGPALLTGYLHHAGIPAVVRFHRVDLYHYGAHNYIEGVSKSQSFPWREELSLADRLVFISTHGRDYYRQNWLQAGFESKALVSRLGTNDHGEGTAHHERGESLVLASCSRITPVKQVHLIAQLAAALARGGRSVVWHHFGVGEDQQALVAIEEAKAQDELKIILHGWTQNAELMRFYHKTPVDLFINLSTSEGVPVSIMEAISFGIPVLATNVDGTPEAVVPGRSGLLCSLSEANATEGLAARVEVALSNGTLAAMTPRTVWAERFDAARNFSELAAEIADLANSRVIK